MTQIGKLNKRITLQYKTQTADGMGGFTEVWTSIIPDIWAAIWPVSAKEMVSADKTTMTVTHRIRIRYRSTISGSWRVKFGTRYFAITGIVNPEERNEWLDLVCIEAS